MNIPLLLDDHCQAQIHEHTAELAGLVDRMVRVATERAVLETLLRVNQAFAAAAVATPTPAVAPPVSYPYESSPM